MGSLSIHVGPFFEWLVRTTLQAGLLVCVILLIQAILGNRLGVRGRYCLWLLLLVRLALPWAPPSRFSAYNLLPRFLQRAQELPIAESGRLRSATVKTDATSGEGPGPVDSTADGAPETTFANRLGSHERSWLQGRTMTVLSLCWLGGACILAGCIIAGNVRLWCAVRRGCSITDRKILNLLQDCRRQMGVRSAVGVIATDKVGGPALAGVFRPRLLLPPETVAETGLNELRYIFLHELAHLKRHDILVGCLASLLHVLHWFNPLIAFGFRRMRADRELACDALALSLLAPTETSAYGRTVVQQIERLLASRRHPALIGLCGVRARIKQRVAMIARFRNGGYRWSPLAILLVGCLAWVGLTDGSARNQGGQPTARTSETTTPATDEPTESQGTGNPATTMYADEYVHVVRIHIRHRQTGKYLVADGEDVTCDADEPGDAGLWEARFDGILGHGGDVFLYSVATGKYLTTDAQGNLATDRLEPDAWACWDVWTGPVGVWVVSREFKNAYVSLHEQDRVKATPFNRDERGCWDIDQLERIR